ncbi:MAG: hypothetical protein HN350_07550 [Phycisphaerales bacterium]|nr:hypothetical protein [Phycisphaerales bacterium]
MAARQVAMIGVGGWLIMLTVALTAGCGLLNSPDRQDRSGQGKQSTMPTSAPSEPESIRVALGDVKVPDGTPDGEWLQIGGDTPLLWCYRSGKRLVFEQEGPKVYLSIDGKPFGLAGIIVRSKEEAMLLDEAAKVSEGLTAWIYSPHLKHLPDLKHIDSIDSIHVWERVRKLLTDLSPLASASKITSLSLRNCQKISDLSALRGLKRLTSLDLYSSLKVEDITPLTDLPITWLDTRSTSLQPASVELLGELSNLRCLKVTAYEEKASIPLGKALPRLSHLERLTVECGSVYTDNGYRLMSFGKMPSLKSLVIEEISETMDLTSLATLTGLRELHLLGRLKADVDLRPITQLQKLRTLRLEIKSVWKRKPSDPPADLTPILALKSLEKLEVASAPPTRGHERLGELPNLKSLILRTPSLTKSPEFKNPQRVISVDFSRRLYWGDSELKDISSLEKLVNLEDLRLHRCTKVEDYSALSKLTKLRHLNISQPGARTLTPLASLVNLEVLLLHNSGITDLSPLRTLKKLKVLEIGVIGDGLERIDRSFRPMVTLTVLDRLPNLIQLQLDGCRVRGLNKVALPSLERVALPCNLTTDQFAEFVQRHPKLTHLRYHTLLWPTWKDVDLSPISQLKHLSSLGVVKISNLDMLGGLHRLTRLHVGMIPERVNLEPLKNLRQLRFLILYNIPTERVSGWEALHSLTNAFKIIPFGPNCEDGDTSDGPPILYQRGAGDDNYPFDIPDPQWR